MLLVEEYGNSERHNAVIMVMMKEADDKSKSLLSFVTGVRSW